MLKQLGKWTSNSALLFPHPPPPTAPFHNPWLQISPLSRSEISIKRALVTSCGARRRAIRDEYEDENEDDEYGHNEQLAVLEMYSQLVKDEILLVRAMVDHQDVELLIFKGFSSCLSDKTLSNPSKSVLPAKAIIQNIDRAKAPFDPSNVQFIEKGLSFDAIMARLTPL